MPSDADFAARVLAWYDQHGRKDLPWQQAVTPYRVWVSEIMLQQTQVATVIPYFQRFMARFPELAALARADVDEVLHLWTGLGYYARARNLQRAAQHCLMHHAGALPATLPELMALPGIGRSTAGAILSLGHGLPAVILDGNVKRVLGRHAAIAGDISRAAIQDRYWQVATERTPIQRHAHYNQAMMDLGALVCTRSRPGCLVCPLQDDCLARQQDATAAYPGRKQRAPLPTREVCWQIWHWDHQVWLQQRPPSGLWGGLWSFPESVTESVPVPVAPDVRNLPVIDHVFTHFRLRIQPLLMTAPVRDLGDRPGRWVKLDALPALGLPQPVLALLQQLPAILESSS